VPTKTQPRRNVLEEKLREFSSEAYVLQAVKLKPRRGEPDYPMAIKLVADGYNQEVGIWRDFEGQLEADQDNEEARLPIIFPTPGFKPKDGETYKCRLQLRGHGHVFFAFPAERYALQRVHEWSREPTAQQEDLVFKRDKKSAWVARHPLYGHRISTFRLNIPDEGDEYRLKMDGLVLVPIPWGGSWAVAPARDARSIKDHELAQYDEAVTSEQRKRLLQRAGFKTSPEFSILGEYLTIFDIVDAPLSQTGQAASSLEELEMNAWGWFQRAEKFEATLQAAVHPDHLPADFSEAERKLAAEEAKKTRESYLKAIDWARDMLHWSIQRLYVRRAHGLSVTFRIPPPRSGRQFIAPPLINLGREGGAEALRQRFIANIREALKPKPKPEPVAEPPAEAAEPKTVRKTAKEAAPKRDEVVYSTDKGDGGSSLRDIARVKVVEKTAVAVKRTRKAKKKAQEPKKNDDAPNGRGRKNHKRRKR